MPPRRNTARTKAPKSYRIDRLTPLTVPRGLFSAKLDPAASGLNIIASV